MVSTIPIHIVSLGCARNEVDSEELAARFEDSGFCLVDRVDDAEVVVVNTCGFIEAAKAESIDEILGAAQLKDQGRLRAVIAAGCLAQRYGTDLAMSLPEADAVLGFDDYATIGASVRRLLGGEPITSHTPVDRRRLLPLAPVERIESASIPAWVPSQRKRLSGAPMAPLKIASGCDRRCAFCSIPSFRGAFQSRLPQDLVREAEWLATQGVKELFLVSENTTSYGKDLGANALESLLADLSKVDQIEWIRLSYLQPAEIRPSLIDAVAGIDKVVPYFDVPFQHGSGSVLKSMRRFGDAESFLTLIDQVRDKLPTAGIRTNVIVGFPGETQADFDTLMDFIGAAGLDAVGVFPYSDEDGTEGASLDGHLDQDEIDSRASQLMEFADTVTSLRAQDRVGEQVKVLVEGCEDGVVVGRAEQQGPEDGHCWIENATASAGEILGGEIVSSNGVDWCIHV